MEKAAEIENKEENEGINSEKLNEILKRMNVDIKKLEDEQIKFSKEVKLKDAIDFPSAKMIAGVDTAVAGKDIIAGIVVIDSDFNVIEEKFAIQKADFPYISGFLAYREMPAMIKCYKKLETDVDFFIVKGNGILHPRKFGIASHFGIAVQKPSIGVAKSLMLGEVKSGKVYAHSKILAHELATKKGGKPIYVSPGHMISLETAGDIVKKLIRPPHKMPEPLHLAHQYLNKIKKELR